MHYRHVLLFVLSIVAFTSYAENLGNTLEQVTWGGGGAFTSTAQLNGKVYLSSDVAGVWRLENEQWQPLVDGLGDYNVTSLAVLRDKLYAITATGLFALENDSHWRSLNISINSYRSVNDQLYSINTNQSLLCFGSRNSLIHCLDNKEKHTSYTLPIKEITGLLFDVENTKKLFFFSNNRLYRFNLNTGKHELVHQFKHKIISVSAVDGRLMITTKNQILRMDGTSPSTHTVLYDADKGNIVNAFPSKLKSKTDFYVVLGDRWNTSLFKLVVDDKKSTLSKLSVSFDAELPHRKHQKRTTKFLSARDGESDIWLTDYWGVYRLKKNENAKQNTIIEYSLNAHNTVATDLIITPDHLYISAMDTGLTAVVRDSYNAGDVSSITPEKLRGHAWSLTEVDDKLYGLFSPWNDANDYLLEFSNDGQNQHITKLTRYDSRQSDGAYWGKAFSRQLTYFNGMVTGRDGKNGGVFGLKDHAFSFEKRVQVGNKNRLFRSLIEYNGALHVSSCENRSYIHSIGEEGTVQSQIELPTGVCIFKFYKRDGELLLLGSKNNKSVIYRLSKNEVSKIYETPIGSAMYSFAQDHSNRNNYALGTTSWSTKSESGLFVTTDDGKTFFDQTCLLSHKNGVAKLDYDVSSASLFVLLKVGGLQIIPGQLVFDENACKEKEPRLAKTSL